MIKNWNWWGELEMTHDYKAALDKIDELGLTAMLFELDYGAIIQALRIADRLMQEPSDGMAMSVNNYWPPSQAVKDSFTVMRDQLLKEIEDVATD